MIQFGLVPYGARLGSWQHRLFAAVVEILVMCNLDESRALTVDQNGFLVTGHDSLVNVLR